MPFNPNPGKNIHFYVITLKLTMKPCSRNRDIPILFHIHSLHLITHRRRRIKNRNQYTFFLIIRPKLHRTFNTLSNRNFLPINRYPDSVLCRSFPSFLRHYNPIVRRLCSPTQISTSLIIHIDPMAFTGKSVINRQTMIAYPTFIQNFTFCLKSQFRSTNRCITFFHQREHKVRTGTFIILFQRHHIFPFPVQQRIIPFSYDLQTIMVILYLLLYQIGGGTLLTNILPIILSFYSHVVHQFGTFHRVV